MTELRWDAADQMSWTGSYVTAPSAPTNVTAALHGRTAIVSWDAPANGSVDKYLVRDQNGQQVATTTGTVRQVSLGSLDYGVTYSFTVTAANAAGAGSTSAKSNTITPMAAPSKMAAPKVRVSGRTALVSWPAAHANGSPVNRYTVTSDRGQRRSVAGTARSTKFAKLRPGKYRWRLTATNGVGTSSASAWASVTVRKPR